MDLVVFIRARLDEDGLTGKWQGLLLEQILDTGYGWDHEFEQYMGFEGEQRDQMLRLLASQWSDHPDYDQAWGPR